MFRPISARLACLLDAIGCAAGAALIWVAPTVWSWLALPDAWRAPVALCLLAFAALAAAAYQLPSRYLMLTVVVGNIGWVVAGAYALAVTESVVGGIIIVAVMIADTFMAWLQLSGTTVSHATT